MRPTSTHPPPPPKKKRKEKKNKSSSKCIEGELKKDVFEGRTSTGSGRFAFESNSGLVQNFEQIVSK